MLDPSEAAVVSLAVVLALALLAGLVYRASKRRTKAVLSAHTPSVLNFLRRLAENDGFLAEAECAGWEDELEAAERHGLVSGGGGWSAGVTITKAGERTIAARAA